MGSRKLSVSEKRRNSARAPTSRYYGVMWSEYRKTWIVCVRTGGAKKKYTFISPYPTEKDAAIAQDRVAKHVHGAKARLNFPKRKLRAATVEQLRSEIAEARRMRKRGTIYCGVARTRSGDRDRWVSPPAIEGPTFTGITGIQGPGR